MTMPYERTRAVLQAREFLQELVDATTTPGVPDEVRRIAFRLLRHYPSPLHMEIAAHACPQWFGSSREVS